MTYTQAAVERAMKVHEVLMQALKRLEEEKRDLERRLAFVQGELEKTRAKLPRGISTS